MPSRKILVTGTAGLIGFHLAKVANSGCEAKFPQKKLLEPWISKEKCNAKCS